jgi:hypothetical protein
MLYEVQECLFATVHPTALTNGSWEQRQRMPGSLDVLNREQQQLLQAVCWGLPEMLLRFALHAVPGEPLFSAAAVAAATWAVKCWHVPSMTAAAAAAGAGIKAQQQQLLPELLDCWLELMQQLLLQQDTTEQQLAALLQQWPPSLHLQQAKQQLMPVAKYTGPGLLLQARNTARVLSLDSSEAQKLMGAEVCGCITDETGLPVGSRSSNSSIRSSNSSSSSSSRCIVYLDCAGLSAVDYMLLCLAAMKVSKRSCGLQHYMSHVCS